MFSQKPKDYAVFRNRREKLLEMIKRSNPNLKDGLVILFADFEDDRHVFRQNSTFYYFTGIEEPASVLFLYFDGREVLYIPNYGEKRERWMRTSLTGDGKIAKEFGVGEIKKLGQPCQGYSFPPLFSLEEYENLLEDLDSFLKKKNEKKVCVLLDILSSKNFFQVYCFDFLITKFPVLRDMMLDISPFVYVMRRVKGNDEIRSIYNATNITSLAHRAAANAIKAGKVEHEVQAMIDAVFIAMGAIPAFPSIVAGGENTTVLHYMQRNQKLKDGDLVVIDIGAQWGNYAADLTRTYPVSGKFSTRQKEVYNIVVETQVYIKKLAKPGMFLNNPEKIDKSLHHLAVAFLENAGYAQYFVHGIGHFIGLDVHDVGDSAIPLEPGNVFTIEPGIYIPEENLGIRIEDDFVIVKGGCSCLSDSLPRRAEEIETLMTNGDVKSKCIGK